MPSTSSRPEVRTGIAGERAAELLGGAPGADHRRAQRGGRRTPGRRTRPRPRPHQRQAGRPRAAPAAPAGRSSAGSGPACGSRRRPPTAGSRGGAPGPAPARRPASAVAGGLATPGWAAGRSRRAGSRASSGRRRSARPRGARARTASRPAATAPWPSRSRSSSCASAVRAKPADQRRAVGLLRAGEQHLAGVRVGRARLGVQVVAVVPDRHQAQVGAPARTSRPGCRRPPGPAPRLARQEPPVALGGPERGGERHVPAGPERRGQRGVEPVQVAGVGDDDERAAAGGERGGGGLGDPAPASPPRAAPPRPRAAARRRRAPAGSRPARYAAHRSPAHRASATGAPTRRRCRCRRRSPARREGCCRASARACRGRDRQPQHVGEVPGVAVGDRPGQPRAPPGCSTGSGETTRSR